MEFEIAGFDCILIFFKARVTTFVSRGVGGGGGGVRVKENSCRQKFEVPQ